MPSPARTPSPGLAVVPLILGGFGIGTTEFVTMGLLPEIAEGIDVTIPQAGHTVSAYALGVVVGAPAIALLGAQLPRRAVLVSLMLVFALGNAASALAPSYGWLVVDRFVSGLPHGAFFGVASIVAHDLARPGLGGRAVARVMLGIPFANVLGVPVATAIGQQAGWRAAYAAIAVIGVLTAIGVALRVPHQPADREASPRRELGALADAQVWLTLAVGAIGFGGTFAMYSYISPILQNQTGLPSDAVPIYLLIYGVGGVVGTLLGGRLVDVSVMRALLGSCLACGLLLAGFDRYRRPLWLAPAAARAWQAMRRDAAAGGIALEAISGYRSHDYQLGIFERKRARGLEVAEILQVNAAPGYSEHHGGEALDIGTPGEPPAEESFETTPAFAWLSQHAARHGFSLSYPRDNPHGIVYEPWHWRFRGRDR